MTDGTIPAQRHLDSHQMRRWQARIFIAGWITYGGYYLGRVNLAIALPAMQAELGWPKIWLGALGSVLYWAYALGQLFNGRLGDRLSARRFVAMGLTLSAVLNLIMSAQSAFGWMLLVWALNGWFQATGWSPIMKTLSRWFTPEQRGRLSAYFAPCYVAGHIASWALAGWLIARHSWRAAFWVPGLLLLGLAAYWYIVARDDPASLAFLHKTTRPALPKGRALLRDVWGNVRKLAAYPAMRWGLVICALSGMIKDGLTLWVPTFLVEQQGLPLSTAAMIGIVVMLAGTIGAFASGFLLHTAAQDNEKLVVVGLATLMVLAIVGLYLAAPLNQAWLTLLCLAALAMGSHGINSMLMSALPLRLGPTGNVSSAAGTLDFVSYTFGGLSTVLVGFLQDALGWGAVYGWWAMIALAIGVWSLHKSAKKPQPDALAR